MNFIVRILLVVCSCHICTVLGQPLPQFPAKRVHLIVPFSAGSQMDTIARVIAPKLNEAWGQPLVVENRPGAGGVVGATVVAKAPPDGHTLLLTSSSFAISAALQAGLPYDPLRDFAGATQIGFSTLVLVVAPSLGVRSMQELITLAKSQPDRILFGSAGAGSSTHLNTVRLNLAAGIKAVDVGFKGQSEALIEILAGRIHYGLAGPGNVLPFIRDGKLLALAVLLPQRSPLMPEVPAISEVLAGYGRDGSSALLAPARTPRTVLNQISNDVARVLELPVVRAKLQGIGFEPAPSTPDEHERILRAQIETFSQVVRSAGIRTQ